MSHNVVVLLLGSNINNPKDNIVLAMKKIEAEIGSIIIKSELIITEPVEFDSCNNFCNIAIQIKTQISPIKLLFGIKKIEKEMGRLQDSSQLGFYSDRIIDIDVIIYNNLKFISDRLTIPHSKNLYERDFAKGLINQIR